MTVKSEVKATVKTAMGEVKEFGDFASQFIVSHPKTSVIIGVVAGWLLGLVM